jgi:hypothetical protein
LAKGNKTRHNSSSDTDTPKNDKQEHFFLGKLKSGNEKKNKNSTSHQITALDNQHLYQARSKKKRQKKNEESQLAPHLKPKEQVVGVKIHYAKALTFDFD